MLIPDCGSGDPLTFQTVQKEHEVRLRDGSLLNRTWTMVGGGVTHFLKSASSLNTSSLVSLLLSCL